jgi:hypothetical protein
MFFAGATVLAQKDILNSVVDDFRAIPMDEHKSYVHRVNNTVNDASTRLNAPEQSIPASFRGTTIWCTAQPKAEHALNV